MTAVDIKWTIRTPGRAEGHIDHGVELTDHIDMLIKAGRVVIVSALGEAETEASADQAALADFVDTSKDRTVNLVSDLAAFAADAEPPVGEPGAEGLTVPARVDRVARAAARRSKDIEEG